MNSSSLRRGRGPRRKKPKSVHGIGRVNRNLEAQFQSDWSRSILRAARCVVRGCNERAVDAHHVVYKRDLKERGLFLWDPRDGMALCRTHHWNHHYGTAKKTLPLTLLTEAHLDFAFEALGAYAFDYLARRYRGDDPRLEARLATCTEEPEGSDIE